MTTPAATVKRSDLIRTSVYSRPNTGQMRIRAQYKGHTISEPYDHAMNVIDQHAAIASRLAEQHGIAEIEEYGPFGSFDYLPVKGDS